MANLSYLFFNVFLVKLNNCGRTVLSIGFLRVQDLKGPPRGPPRVDFGFISVAEETNLFLLEDALPIADYLDGLLHVLDHIFVSLCLLCNFGKVNRLLDLFIHGL